MGLPTDSSNSNNPDLYDLHSNSTNFLNNGIRKIVTAAKATTPVSLLVESLVQQLCTMLEPDRKRSSDLYNSICEQLYQMHLIDETFAMGEFETMRTQYQRALYQLVCVARGQELPHVFENVWPLAQPIGLDWSRYHREFEEIDFIAGGGFGKVFKARHKLDGIEYAVKKVNIKSTTINHVLHHLSEVKTLASLNHINIVPYKAAWLEPLIADKNKDNNIDSSDEEDDIYEHRETHNFEDSSSDFIVFQNSTDTNESKSDAVLQENSSAKNKIVPIYHHNNNKIDIGDNQPHLKLKWATLYIQMSLCQLTLREWLDSRNNHSNIDIFYSNFSHDSENIVCCNMNVMYDKNKSKLTQETNKNGKAIEMSSSDDNTGHPTHITIISDIFSQLLNGLHYIHSRGIVHHDIKPSNIFVAVDKNGKLHIQLGDFGLACPLKNTPHSTTGVGTPLYAAPEQLSGDCDPKSDVYSLGVILIELLLPFSTDMERIQTIKKVRSGENLPKLVNDCFTNLVTRLLSNRRNRPDIFQLYELINKLSVAKNDNIVELQKQLSEQEDKINELKTQLSIESNKSESSSLNLELELQKNLEILKNKDLEINELKIKIEEELADKDNELRSKDEEILRLRKMLDQQRL